MIGTKNHIRRVESTRDSTRGTANRISTSKSCTTDIKSEGRVRTHQHGSKTVVIKTKAKRKCNRLTPCIINVNGANHIPRRSCIRKWHIRRRSYYVTAGLFDMRHLHTNGCTGGTTRQLNNSVGDCKCSSRILGIYG